MKHRFFACYYSNSSKVDIILRIGFENYEEMSESAKKAFENKEITFPFYINTKSTYNYQNLVGDLLLHENFYFSELFEAVSNKILFSQQLYFTKQDCTNYVLRDSFTKNYFEIFASNRLLNLYRKVAKSIDVSTQSLKIEHLNIDDNKSDFIFYYESDNIRDIVFSSIHFALENGYKFSQCSHCRRWFFKEGSRAGSNKKYCNRKSTFNGYEHLPCEQAVRNINQELQREKKRIYNSMVREHLSTEQFVYDFLDECAEYMTKIKKCASVQNLSDYWSFLKKYKDGVNNG